MTRVAVLGAGAFGTALAVALSRGGRAVTLWARDPRDMATRRENTARLPGIAFPEGLTVTGDLQSASRADIVLLAVPMQALAGFMDKNAPLLDGKALIACCKGVDLASGRGPAGIMGASCPGARVAVLSGPGFADDIARGLPTALTLASRAGGTDLQAALSTDTLRLYRSADVTGVELGGALKNVIAIAAGLTIGAGLGESARAALITRGFAEMNRYAIARGAAPETLAGLSGLGDLVLTATSAKSRNTAFGLALGRGGTAAPPPGTTVEGLATARAVAANARRAGIDMPITGMVVAVLDETMTINQARDALLARPLKQEFGEE
ncbi:MAG TPA: NAD(P)-dependent glycerol-3-phosphate dehydrogenase [Aliiroseovarius sp.]|nr:NAD(P)-dependent glycerol-3-phosphate dehydrogenase [Aliiroseovarius sp.]